MNSESAFSTRGLEFHGDRMWSWNWVLKALNFMEANDMNLLVFHQIDLIDQLVVPHEYFSAEDMWKSWPVRYHSIDSNRHYIRQVIRQARRRNIKFCLEVKEITFHESILEVAPQVLGRNGRVCPTDPFWFQFLGKKMKELLHVVPEIDGVIVSPATRETKVSIASRQCDCERCLAADATDWYAMLLSTMFEPLDEAEKKLVVRDFSYTRKEQGAVLEAAAAVSPKIVVSLKNTPHDYYPTFPHNPKIGAVGNHPQWVEFDAWGQFFGLGVFPSLVADDYRHRFIHCAREGAEGVIVRIDWEGITDANALDSLNMANVYAFALLSQTPSMATETALDQWLEEPVSTPFGWGQDDNAFLVPPTSASHEVLKSVMQETWPVIRQSIFVLGHVFHEDGMFPDTLKKAFMMLLEIHGIADWAPEREHDLDPHPETFERILQEKDRASRAARKLRERIALTEDDLPAYAYTQLIETFDLLVWYVDGFRACAKACFSTQLAVASGETAHALSSVDELAVFRDDLCNRLTDTWYGHQVYWLLDEGRLEHLVDDLRRILSEAGSVVRVDE